MTPRGLTIVLGVAIAAIQVFAFVGLRHSENPSYPTENEIGPVIRGFVDALNDKNVSLALSFTVYKFAYNDTYQNEHDDISRGLKEGGDSYHIELNSIEIVRKDKMSEAEKERVWYAIGAVEATIPVRVLDYCFVEMQVTSTFANQTNDATETRTSISMVGDVMVGVEMLWIVVGIVVLVAGITLLPKRSLALGPYGIILIMIWLVAIVVTFTYAEQHDDPWEKYIGNIGIALGAALTGFLSSLVVINQKFKSLNQRLDDHMGADAEVRNQFEKRIMERLDRIVGKPSGAK